MSSNFCFLLRVNDARKIFAPFVELNIQIKSLKNVNQTLELLLPHSASLTVQATGVDSI
jgi:hypothetical protein